MIPDLENPADEISPRKARREFLNARRGNVKESTYRTYKYPTDHFADFCEENEIESIGKVGGYVIESWKQTRKGEVKQITLHNNVKTLRVFVRWCEKAELVERGTADRMEIPEVTKEQAVSNESIPLNQAEQILRYLSTYEYASRRHALFKTMWHTGCRISGAIALDVEDVVSDGNGAILRFQNRTVEGTPLKNGNGGERNVTLNEDTHGVLVDYIEGKRPDVTDQYDRKPLFCTGTQRVERQRAYKNFTAITRPCVVTGDCPHDRDIDGCDAASRKKEAFGCPSSKSLHPIRRGSITYHIERGWPKEKLAERVDVSVEVLNKHYDARSKEQEREGREQFLDLL
ncbi:MULTISPECIES: tyrosine-type recombinase/integrase [Halobacterium]|uniref:tyrosine-type recombinase/integrase n=1 Tax=Halobacterium TaxID=2239 RepID=UPI001E632274|nr:MULTISPECIES: site-specific integrase [Halobacterium]MDL0124689.1 tyrosine-type recombinase/integrase [Halobacterium salinarum]UHH26438.1 site-specific integrase [Halobacterium noricense]